MIDIRCPTKNVAAQEGLPPTVNKTDIKCHCVFSAFSSDPHARYTSKPVQALACGGGGGDGGGTKNIISPKKINFADIIKYIQKKREAVRPVLHSVLGSGNDNGKQILYFVRMVLTIYVEKRV